MTERVLIPKTERSVKYHTCDCGHVDQRQAYELAREDAELLGRKPAACIERREGGGDGPDARPPEVPA